MLNVAFDNQKAKPNIRRVGAGADALALQILVQGSLLPAQQIFLKNRSLADYQNLAQSGCLYGAYYGPQLVALVIFTQHRAERYKTDFNPTGLFRDAIKSIYDFGIIGGLMVRPECRGQQLSRLLIDHILALPEITDLESVFAETVAENFFSINSFVQSGFVVLGQEHFAPLNTDLCLLRYDVDAAKAKRAALLARTA